MDSSNLRGTIMGWVTCPRAEGWAIAADIRLSEVMA